MKILQFFFIYFFSVLLLSGCNSIYFYETQKYSLTIEGRPDATSPAAFNFGVKHRVATVIPSKDNANNKEALSLISYFNLIKDDDGGLFNDSITVESALITGKAANKVSQRNGDSVGKALNAMTSD